MNFRHLSAGSASGFLRQSVVLCVASSLKEDAMLTKDFFILGRATDQFMCKILTWHPELTKFLPLPNLFRPSMPILDYKPWSLGNFLDELLQPIKLSPIEQFIENMRHLRISFFPFESLNYVHIPADLNIDPDIAQEVKEELLIRQVHRYLSAPMDKNHSERPIRSYLLNLFICSIWNPFLSSLKKKNLVLSTLCKNSIIVEKGAEKSQEAIDHPAAEPDTTLSKISKDVSATVFDFIRRLREAAKAANQNPNEDVSKYIIDEPKKKELDLDKCKTAKDLYYKDAGYRLGKKLEILDLLKQGKRNCEIAAILKLHRNTISKVKKLLKANPNLTAKDLIEKKRGPSKNAFKKISLSVFLVLKVILGKVCPILFGISFTTWPAEAIRVLLKKYCQIEVKLSYIYYFVKRTNLTSKFAARKNPKQDDNAVEKFIKIEFQKICDRAIKFDETILFADEVHVQCGNRAKGYAEKGKKAIMSSSTSTMHTTLSLLVFVGMNGYVRIFKIHDTFNAEKFKVILKQIKRENNNKVLRIILDNARIHHAKIIKTWLKHPKGGKYSIKMSFLPAYSPDLNPAERWNNIFKQKMRKTYCKDQAEIDDLVNVFIKDYNEGRMTEKVKKLFEDERCNYTLTCAKKALKILERCKTIFKKCA